MAASVNLRYSLVAYLVVAICISLQSSKSSAAVYTGRVIDASKSPISSATVHLIRRRPAYLVPEAVRPVAESETDGEGRFTIDTPVTSGLALLTWAEGKTMSLTSIRRGTRIDRLEVVLQDAAEITGSISTEDGKPLQATIGPLLPAPDCPAKIAAQTFPQWVETDAAGRFRIDHLHVEGRYQFAVSAPNHVVRNISARPETAVTVQLFSGGGTIRGQLIAPQLKPLLEANIRIPSLGLSTRATTAGVFRFSGLPPGSHSLEPVLRGGIHVPAKEVILEPNEETSVTIQLPSGFYVEGVVIDSETSKPLEEVNLRVLGQDTSSTAQGKFRAGPFFGNKWRPIEVTAPLFERDPGDTEPEIRPNGSDDITSLQIRVLHRCFAYLRVEDMDSTSEPLTLRICGSDGLTHSYQHTVTKSPTPVPFPEPGLYYFYGLTPSSSISNVTSVTATRRKVTQARLQVGSAARVTGRITRSGTPTSSATQSFRVLVESAPGSGEQCVIRETMTDDTGAFSLSDLPGGVVYVTAIRDDQHRTSKRLTLTPGRTSAVTFDFPWGNIFAGRVTDTLDRPLNGVVVKYFFRGSGDSGQGRYVSTDTEGRFRAEDIFTEELDAVQVEQAGFFTYRTKNIPLPAEDFQVQLKPAPRLQVRAEGNESDTWDLTLMLCDPWKSGAYPEQLLGRPMVKGIAAGVKPTTMEVPNPGRYRVVGMEHGGAVAVSDVIDWNETTSETEVVLSPARTVRLRGTFPAGEKENVDIIAINTTLPDGKTQTEFTTSTSNGRFELTDLPAGDYLILATGTSTNGCAVNVNLVPGTDREILVEPIISATISGRVVRGSSAAAGYEVQLISQTNPAAPQRKANTDRTGEFHFDNVESDEYLVSVRNTSDTGAGEVLTQKAVTVSRTRQPEPLTIDLTPARTVTMEVPSGLGIKPGQEITFVHLESREMIKARWAESKLQAELPAGAYELWRGDEVIGRAAVARSGSGIILKK